MKHLKENTKLRLLIMTVLFVLGMSMLFLGFNIAGKLIGLGIMLFGVAALLVALYVYNSQFQD